MTVPAKWDIGFFPDFFSRCAMFIWECWFVQHKHNSSIHHILLYQRKKYRFLHATSRSSSTKLAEIKTFMTGIHRSSDSYLDFEEGQSRSCHGTKRNMRALVNTLLHNTKFWIRHWSYRNYSSACLEACCTDVFT